MADAPRVLVVEDRTWQRSPHIARALDLGFRRHGWSVKTEKAVLDRREADGFDLIAGWGWGGKAMAWARRLARPGRFLHVDNALVSLGREPAYFKLSLGSQWPVASDADFPEGRLRALDLGSVMEPREANRGLTLLCGISPHAARHWGQAAIEWEVDAMREIEDAGGKVFYRPKPHWDLPEGLPRRLRIDPNRRRPLPDALRAVDSLLAHHSNGALEALVAGLPIHINHGFPKQLSTERAADLVTATAAPVEERERLLREAAWHQWTMDELERGAWLEEPAPLAALGALHAGEPLPWEAPA